MPPKAALTEHMKQRYEKALTMFRLALCDDVSLTLTQFCRDNDIELRPFTSWMSRHKHLEPYQVRNEVRKTKGLVELSPRCNLNYASHLDAFHKALEKNLDLSLSDYCRKAGIRPEPFHHWLMRQDMSVDKLKTEVAEAIGLEIGKKDKGDRLFPTTIFKRTVSGYRKELEEGSQISLQSYCRKRGVDYHAMRKWMTQIGLTITDIRGLVRNKEDMPVCRKKVFIQFKPNGGTSSDSFHGVRISLPDGSRIEVEKCSVMALCSFVNIYDNKHG